MGMVWWVTYDDVHIFIAEASDGYFPKRLILAQKQEHGERKGKLPVLFG